MEDAWGGVDEAGLRAANPVISAILAQQPALCSVLRAPNGSDNGGCTYCAGVRNVFQLAALDGPCVCVCVCTTPIRGTGIIEFRRRDTTMDGC
jgi:hypothetical protein